MPLMSPPLSPTTTIKRCSTCSRWIPRLGLHSALIQPAAPTLIGPSSPVPSASGKFKKHQHSASTNPTNTALILPQRREPRRLNRSRSQHLQHPGNAGFASATAMANNINSLPKSCQLRQSAAVNDTISPDQNDTALNIQVMRPQTTIGADDHATNLSVVQNGELANSSSLSITSTPNGMAVPGTKDELTAKRH